MVAENGQPTAEELEAKLKDKLEASYLVTSHRCIDQRHLAHLSVLRRAAHQVRVAQKLS